MKRVLSFLLIFNIGVVFAENTIVAIVNNIVITHQSIEANLSNATSDEEKISIVNNKIDSTIQLQKAKSLNIEASKNDVIGALLSIAKSNNISIDQLRSYPEFSSLEIEVSNKISILNLQRLVTKNIGIAEEEILNQCFYKFSGNGIKQIKIAQIIISEINTQTTNDKDMAIKSFLNKLADHIIKGASFESIAKLHSQHSSYKNGGISSWIEVNSPTMVMLDALKDNEISKVYLTNFGFAIGIKVDERIVSSDLKKCKEELIYLKAENFYSNWVKELREDSYIRIYHDKL